MTVIISCFSREFSAQVGFDQSWPLILVLSQPLWREWEEKDGCFIRSRMIFELLEFAFSQITSYNKAPTPWFVFKIDFLNVLYRFVVIFVINSILMNEKSNCSPWFLSLFADNWIGPVLQIPRISLPYYSYYYLTCLVISSHFQNVVFANIKTIYPLLL